MAAGVVAVAAAARSARSGICMGCAAAPFEAQQGDGSNQHCLGIPTVCTAVADVVELGHVAGCCRGVWFAVVTRLGWRCGADPAGRVLDASNSTSVAY